MIHQPSLTLLALIHLNLVLEIYLHMEGQIVAKIKSQTCSDMTTFASLWLIALNANLSLSSTSRK